MSFSSIASPIKSSLGIKAFTYNDGQDSSPLPYDAKVEYLESDGYSIFDLGFNGTEQFTCTIQIYRPTISHTFGFGAFGTYSSGRENAVGGFLENQGWTYLYVTKKGTWSQMYVSNVKTDFLYDTIFNISRSSNGQITRTVYSPSTGITKKQQNITNPFETTGYVTLFLNRTTEAGTRIIYARIDDNDVHLDLIPVRFTNEFDEDEGAMYDLVSGKLFRNQGTGSFIIGPDL